MIQYVIGDATRPQGEGLKVIAHCVNDTGGWGAGFVCALSNRWTRPEKEYRRWFRERQDEFHRMLGCVQLVPVEKDIWVANIIGQVNIRPDKDGRPPVRYEALARGFDRIADYAKANPERDLSIHAPRLGSGLAGGSWPEIEAILEKSFIRRGLSVTIYDLP